MMRVVSKGPIEGFKREDGDDDIGIYWSFWKTTIPMFNRSEVKHYCSSN